VDRIGGVGRPKDASPEDLAELARAEETALFPCINAVEDGVVAMRFAAVPASWSHAVAVTLELADGKGLHRFRTLLRWHHAVDMQAGQDRVQNRAACADWFLWFGELMVHVLVSYKSPVTTRSKEQGTELGVQPEQP
jgi:hypothetical protein